MVEQDKIEEIKRATDIADLIGQYVPLKKIGRNFRGLCPFHAEKTPSFYVSPDKGIFYCFGCKKGGNAITFLMEYEHLDFPDALKKLAQKAGIEIDTTRGLRHKALYDVNELAGQYFQQALQHEVGARGVRYLNERGIDAKQLAAFRLGYAPPTPGLVAFMRQHGVSGEHLAELGLISGRGEVFHDRLMFPIFNLAGRIIGFGGRGIDEGIQPKYLNSPETPIFRKGEVLYGLHQAKEAIREKSEVVVVEGYFDLLSLVQRGITQVCAPLGTALTEGQCMLIGRYARKANILFDRDRSGVKAALRAIGLLINAQVDVHVAVLPEDYDPDEFVRERGANALLELLKEAPDFFHFYRTTVKTETVEQEVGLIKDLLQIVNGIQDPIRLDRYVKHAARVFDLPVEKIHAEMARKTVVPKPEPVPGRRTLTPEEQTLVLVYCNLEHLDITRECLRPDDLTDARVRRLYEIILQQPDTAELDPEDPRIDGDLRHILYEAHFGPGRPVLGADDFRRQLALKCQRLRIGRFQREHAEELRSGDKDSQRRLNEMRREELQLQREQ